MNSLIYIYNYTTESGVVREKVIPKAISIQWTKRLFDIGGFEMHFHKDDDCFVRGKIISSHSNYGKIEKVVKTYDDIAVYGYDLKGLLNQRFVYNRTFENMRVENIFKAQTTENIISPSDPNRHIPFFKNARNYNRGTTIENWMCEKERLSNDFKALGKQYEIGYEVAIKDNEFIFDIVKGNDLSKKLVFSRAYKNIGEVEYKIDGLNAVNFSYAEKTDDETKETTVISSGESIGYDRYEGYIQNSENIETYLSENKVSEVLTGTLNVKTTYRQDWNIGDFVTVRYEDIYSIKQITEVKEIYEKSNTRIVPTFGTEKENKVIKMVRGGLDD